MMSGWASIYTLLTNPRAQSAVRRAEADMRQLREGETRVSGLWDSVVVAKGWR